MTRDQTKRDQTKRDQTKSAAASPKFYRLTMLGGVQVVRVKGGVSSVITGEELVAVFSLESRGLDKIAFIPAVSAPRDAAPLSECARTMPHTSMHSSFSSRITSHAALAMMPLIFGLAQNAPAAAEDDSLDSVTVTFGGKLIMVAATLPEDQLPTQDDIRFDVSGPRAGQ